MRKRLFSALLAVAVFAAMFTGCGNQSKNGEKEVSVSDQAAADRQAETEGAAKSGNPDQVVSVEGTLVVATLPGMQKEVMEQAKEILSKEGIEIEINADFNDYLMPNLYVDADKADANYFQHKLYLENFNKRMDTDLVEVATVHFEPLGVYPGRKDSIDALSDGDTIVIPEDGANKSRALKLLAKAGIISLSPDTGTYATIQNISGNPHGVSVLPADASLISSMVGEAAMVVLNGNYARDAFFSVKDQAIAAENPADPEMEPYWNVIAVKSDRADDPKVKRLAEVMESQEIKDFINNSFDGAAVAE